MRATFSYIVVSEFCTSLYVLSTVTMTLNTVYMVEAKMMKLLVQIGAY